MIFVDTSPLSTCSPSTGYLFRATSGGISRIAGLAPIENVHGVENFNLTEFVNGHMAYRAAIPRLLREVGWEVESDEFTEIEDPDPDNHGARQRELIKEIEDARKEAEAEPKKRRFGIFKRSNLAKKKGWETYDERSKEAPNPETSNDDKGVLFDIDAIRAELESEQMEVRQLESTLPPMKLDLNGPPKAAREEVPEAPFSVLRATKSLDSSSLPTLQPSDSESPNPHFPNGHSSHPDRLSDDITDPPTHADSQITMSFDPPPLPSAAFAWESQDADAPVKPHRPELKTAKTTPAAMGGPHLTHNAWADDEEEDFCGEREVQMSFE